MQHWPGFLTNAFSNDAYVEGLGRCVQQGLTQAVGVSNYREDRIRKATARLAVCVQCRSGHLCFCRRHLCILLGGLCGMCAWHISKESHDPEVSAAVAAKDHIVWDSHEKNAGSTCSCLKNDGWACRIWGSRWHQIRCSTACSTERRRATGWPRPARNLERPWSPTARCHR